MKNIQLAKGTAEFYDDIKCLPMEQFNAFQVQLLQDAGVGSTIFDYDAHQEKLNAFLMAGKLDEAKQEAENKRFNIWLLLNGENTKLYSICCLLNKIGDREITDFSDDGLKKHHDELIELGITLHEIEQILDEVKKKLISI